MQFIETLNYCWQQKVPAVIATIIETKGSTYRQLGAKSVFLAGNDQFKGILSGGCVEEDLRLHCKKVLEEGQSQIINYDFGNDDLTWGLGVGCNGGLKVWLHPFDPTKYSKETKRIINLYEKAFTSKDAFSVISVINSSVRIDQLSNYFPLIFDESDLHHLFDILEVENLSNLIKQRKTGLVREEVSIKDNGHKVDLEFYVETVNPVKRMVIFGAGPDAIPLVEGAKLLGWYVTLVDHRSAYANQEAFPRADEIIIIGPNEFPKHLRLDKNTKVVIKSHHFYQDLIYLENLLYRNPSYIGVLGARSRTERILKKLKLRGHKISKDQLERLFFPAGLNIGAETPEEIALSILSEIVSHPHHQHVLPLKWKKGRIHERSIESRCCSSNVVGALT